MLQKLISNLEVVDSQISEFKRDLDTGIIRDLAGLDESILYICDNVQSLSEEEYAILKPQFLHTYENVRELKHLINNELDATSHHLSSLNESQSGQQKYSKIANDN